MLKLSPRMQLIYNHLIPGEAVWDLCCDHGYLGLKAYESGLFPDIYFVDQVASIISKLEKQFYQEHFKKDSAIRAHFLPQQGEDIPQVLTGSVVIAGVGGHTIHKIVHALQGQARLQAQRLILVPQKDDEMLLRLLTEIPRFSYKLCNEDYKVEERGRHRKVLIFNHF